LPKFLSDSQNDTVTPDSDPGSILDSRLRGNDGETPITVAIRVLCILQPNGHYFWQSL
jgi:hypothetical protein